MNSTSNNEIKLSIGDINIGINWKGSTAIDWPSRFYNGFTSNKKPDVTLSVKCGILPDYKKGKLIFDAENNWKLYQNKKTYIMEEFDTLTHKKDRIIIIDNNFSCGEVHITPEPTDRSCPSWSIHRVIDPFLKVLLANRLTKKEGVMVHGLAVSDNGKGVLFAGRSGAGKSTLANLYKGYQGAVLINDEKTIILKKEGQYFIQGTPWPGDSLVCAAHTAPLRKIFFIKHNRSNRVFSLSESDSFNLFFQQLFLPFWDREAIGRVMKFSEDLIKTIKPFEFGFIKDKKAVDFIRRNYNA